MYSNSAALSESAEQLYSERAEQATAFPVAFQATAFQATGNAVTLIPKD